MDWNNNGNNGFFDEENSTLNKGIENSYNKISENELSNNYNNEYNKQQKPKGVKLWVILVVLLLIIILGVGIYVAIYMLTDFLKSDKALFVQYAGESFSKIKYTFVALDNEGDVSAEKYKQDISVDIDFIQGIGTSEENGNNKINNLRLEVSSRIDNSSGYNAYDVSLVGDTIEKFNLEYILNKEQEYVSVDGITEGYVLLDQILDNNQIKSVESIDFSQLSTIDMMTIAANYMEILNTQIADENFETLENQSILINEEQVMVNAHIMTLSDAEYKNLVITILEQLKQDETILGLIKNEEVRAICIQYLDTYINELKAQQINEEIEYKYTIYVKNGEVVSTKFEDGKQIVVMEWLDASKLNIMTMDVNEENKFNINIIGTEDNLNIKAYETNSNVIELDYSNSTEGNEIEEKLYIQYKTDNARLRLNINVDRENNATFTANEVSQGSVVGYNEEMLTSSLEKISTVFATLTENDLTELMILFGTADESQLLPEEESGVSETEKARYNAEFELLIGENLDSEKTFISIEAIKNKVSDYEVISNEVLRLKIEPDSSNLDKYNVISNVVENSNNNYDIELEYDNETGFVTGILLTIVEED